jgi:acyl-CoA reductase-like NAD-dependent aldehyde dehydrogenase
MDDADVEAVVPNLMLEFSCPFGGFKQSGAGRGLEPEGMAAYLEVTSISLPVGFEP